MERESITDRNIESYKVIPSPEDIAREMPLTERAEKTVRKARKEIEGVLDGKDLRKIIIAGPCSIHNAGEAIEYALNLKKLSEKVRDEFIVIMRAYFEKPRTTLGWKGLINDPNIDNSFNIEKGLKISRELLLKINEIGIPAATEFLDPIIPPYIADLISWASVGARTSESQIHRQMASGLSMPVGFKNSTFGSIDTAINAIKSSSSPHHFIGINSKGRICKISTKGNSYCNIVLRGSIHGTNYEEEKVKAVQERLQNNRISEKVIIDCSHGNSQKDFRKQPEVFMNVIGQIKDGNKNIAGLMIESNLKEGGQKISVDSGKCMIKRGISITDACIGWETTENLVLEAHKLLR